MDNSITILKCILTNGDENYEDHDDHSYPCFVDGGHLVNFSVAQLSFKFYSPVQIGHHRKRSDILSATGKNQETTGCYVFGIIII